MQASEFDLDKVILEFTDKMGTTEWTIRNAVEGVQIFGGIGSGKTSGSGRKLALKYLSNNFGGLVLTAKHDEKLLWEDYCRQANRSQDLIICEPEGKHSFNVLEYESNSEAKKSFTRNIVQVLKTVIQAGQDRKSGGGGDDAFWENALDLLMSNTIDLCLIAYGKITVDLLYQVAQSAPRQKKENKAENKAENNKAEPEVKPPPKPFQKAYDEAMKCANNQVYNWASTLSEEAKSKIKSDTDLTYYASQALGDVRTMNFIRDFFFDSFTDIPEKTRSIIDFVLLQFLNSLLREPVYSLFCNKVSTFTPEDCLNGKIILLNIPVKDYHEMGRDCQIMFKYIWQRAMERRRISENDRPVFLWADEAQNFLHEYDAEYQATARSSRIATVYISQNLPNYYANMGGSKADHRVKSFLGTLGTKIFHANADIETNKYASDLIGEAYQKEESEATCATDGKVSVTKTISSRLEKRARPEQFGTLKAGGKANQSVVTGYIHVQGKLFSNGLNSQKTSFTQATN